MGSSNKNRKKRTEIRKKETSALPKDAPQIRTATREPSASATRQGLEPTSAQPKASRAVAFLLTSLGPIVSAYQVAGVLSPLWADLSLIVTALALVSMAYHAEWLNRCGRYRMMVFAGTAVALCVLVYLCGIDIHKRRRANELQALSGRLLPGTEPTPPNPCSSQRPFQVLRPGDPLETVILIGGNAHAFNKFPHVVAASEDRNGHLVPVLTAHRAPAGYLYVELDIRSPDGKIVVRMDHDGFSVNPNNVLKIIRPDESTLKVLDQEGAHALNVHFINSRAIRIDGYLSVQGKRINLTFPGSACIRNFGTDTVIAN